MAKNIENKIILTRIDKPIKESSLQPNKYKVTKDWLLSYHGLVPTEQSTGRNKQIQEVINSINATRDDEPKKLLSLFNR